MITSDINDFSLALGVKGFLSEWNYDVSAVYGQDAFEFGVINSLNTSYGPTSQTSFDAGTLTYDQLTLNVDFNREVDVSFLDSSVSVAFGAEYRTEGYKIEAGEEASYAQGTFGQVVKLLVKMARLVLQARKYFQALPQSLKVTTAATMLAFTSIWKPTLQMIGT